MLFNLARFLGSALGALAVLLAADGAMAGTPAGPVETDTIGTFVTATRTFFLRNSNSGGAAAVTVSFGPAGAVPAMGNFDGTNATDTIGAYLASTGFFYLKNTNTPGNASIPAFRFGPVGGTMTPLVGNWNGTGGDSIGLYDSVNGKFLLRNTNSGGNADITISFGAKNAGLVGLRGNWNGTGGDTIDGIGVYNPATGTFFLKNNPASGPADLTFKFGGAGQGLIPVVGNWNDDDTDTVGVYNPATQTFFLRNTNSSGNADLTFRFGGTGSTPVAGNYDGN